MIFEKILKRLEEELIPLNQEITRYFYELKDTDNPKYIYAVGRSNALTDFKYDIKQLAEEFATDTNVGNNGWIPCSERLPKNNKEVLCYAKSTARGGDVMFVGSQDNGCWFLPTAANTLSYPNQYIVKAWQPLPQPYKESE